MWDLGGISLNITPGRLPPTHSKIIVGEVCLIAASISCKKVGDSLLNAYLTPKVVLSSAT